MSKNNNSGANMSHPEESRKLWPFFFIIPILGFSFFPISGSPTPDQTGTASCTVAIGASVCTSTTITFAPSFPIAPTMLPTGTVGGMAAFYSFYCFVCPQNSTLANIWVGMPAAQTEIFGDLQLQHEIVLQNINLFVAYTGVVMQVACGNPSNTLGAFLQPQFSLDGGTTWSQVAATAGQLNIVIDNTRCPTGVGSLLMDPLGQVAIASALTTPLTSCNAIGCVIFRIVGQGGGGTGDNPMIHAVRLDFIGQIFSVGRILFLSVTAASFQARCSLPVKVGVATLCNMPWLAEIT